ncbi:MAG: hypothetical protein JWN45_3163, partial [Acidobacteriaceae bacterium]|nr:hypothetical protein [Acidobacteriaceae bacterium]
PISHQQTVVSASKMPHLLWEIQALAYNLRLAFQIFLKSRKRQFNCIYQRHGRYVFSGALIAWLLRRPLILEYNGSEVWIAAHWDYSRLNLMLRWCEQSSLRTAHLIVVVSEPLKLELLDRGIEEQRILVIPNAVDPDYFKPDCGGRERRRLLGIRDDEILCAFVGTFGYWHGVGVLADAINQLQAYGSAHSFKFLLLGTGVLWQETYDKLQNNVQAGHVIMPGRVPHTTVREYLDAADILLSPHVPTPDGRPFIGSPTKIFEYMAMEKAIIASRLDQIGHVLTHGKSAVLTTPGSSEEIVAAILELAGNSEARRSLGRAARQSVLIHHTWQNNARRVLEHLPMLATKKR